MINTDTYKQKLEIERKQIMGDISKMGKNIDPSRGIWDAVPEKMDEIESDENDLADRHEGYERDSEEVRVFSERLREIDSALENIENGKYGICRVCGRNIEADRLLANTAAQTCKEHLND